MNSPVARGAIIGTLLQLVMVVAGHFSPQIAEMFPILGTAIGGVAGVLATHGSALPLGRAATNGGIAGVISGVLGTIVSVLLGDVPWVTVAIAAVSTLVLGAVGGVVGSRMGAASARA